MFKRLLVIAAGVAAGLLLATAVLRLRPAWSRWSDRDLRGPTSGRRHRAEQHFPTEGEGRRSRGFVVGH